jgi:hypothetical protein
MDPRTPDLHPMSEAHYQLGQAAASLERALRGVRGLGEHEDVAYLERHHCALMELHRRWAQERDRWR